jgi:glutamyl-tRNA reductase
VPFACLGLSHRSAPAEVRERHAFPQHKICEALVALRDYEAVREAAIISTCNRLEIYAELDDETAGFAQLRTFLTNFRHGDIAYDLEPYLYALTGADAVRHLFSVTTGLDSMLVGDAEVLGQVKEAYGLARQSRSAGETLHRAFREAITTGKAARSRTAIANESVSIATAAIALAKEHVGSLEGKRVLVVGAGKMGKIAAKRLKLEADCELIVANRTHQRARDLVKELGIGAALELSSLGEALGIADIVIASTGAPHFVITPELVGEAMQLRPNRPLCIVDIAIPRDVDPNVATIEGVRVSDIDAMSKAVDVTLDRRRAAIPAVERIVDERVSAFEGWYRSRGTMSVIASLGAKAEAIRTAELDRLLARCPGMGDRERGLVAGMSMSIVSKLLHSAIARIRDDAGAEAADVEARVRLIGELFELEASSLARERAGPLAGAG